MSLRGRCLRDLEHDFDVESGWCLNGCGWRDDGTTYRLRRPVPGLVDFTEPRHRKDDDE